MTYTMIHDIILIIINIISLSFLGAHAPLEIAPVSLFVSESHFFQPWHEITRYGPVRYRMVLYGPLWSYKVPYGPIRSLMVQYGTAWSDMVPYGPILYCMVLYSTVWHHLVLFGPVWSRWYCMVPHGTIWSCLVLYGT